MTYPLPPFHSASRPTGSGLLRHPEAQELADLVRELYTEGTLTYQELHDLSHMPELHTHLRASLDHIDPLRRLVAATPA